MAIKKYRPVTPGRRHGNIVLSDEITKKTPEKSLTEALRKKGGRNNLGRITSRGKGGGHKRRYRLVDFKYSKKGITGTVEAIEYDPNRSANIALIKYADNTIGYIIAPFGIKVGGTIQCGPGSKIEVGNSMPLKDIPVGTEIYCIEMDPGHGAKIARSAGNNAILMAKDGGNAHINMPSGEVRLVKENCYATIGRVGNLEHENVAIGKAGRSRYMGRRPLSRAVAKNPVDHPMGGGEGKSSGGRHPVTPWGKITKGLKTRRKGKASSSKIIKRRK
ncbi:MAG: 50S ribosomal protein L2 [Candidatus Omnitrophica bacterium]|nr:50S ribosomal protein L2 [Candidatus Omnitrophota bacterium]MDD5487395.1 50S ribosomal protein L2 [Candidatus Omnitrophota bacterium]